MKPVSTTLVRQPLLIAMLSLLATGLLTASLTATAAAEDAAAPTEGETGTQGDDDDSAAGDDGDSAAGTPNCEAWVLAVAYAEVDEEYTKLKAGQEAEVTWKEQQERTLQELQACEHQLGRRATFYYAIARFIRNDVDGARTLMSALLDFDTPTRELKEEKRQYEKFNEILKENGLGKGHDESPAESAPVEPTVEAPPPSTEDKLTALLARVEQLERQVKGHDRRLRGSSGPRLTVDLGGRLQTELRFRLQEKSAGQWYNRKVLRTGLSRAEVLAKLKAKARFGRFQGVLDMDFVLIGKHDQPTGLETLSDREALHPYRIEAHSAYVQVRDLFAAGLDLRIGQQLVMWGVGDQFNPTNNLNADDIEDPLLFGEQQGNLMLRLDYTIKDIWTISGVLVPLFKPALLPASGALSTASVDRLPFTDPNLRYRIHSESELSKQFLGFPTVLDKSIPVLPDFGADNMQFALRVAGVLGGQDLALSYYRGRFDFPQPFLNASTLDETPMCEGDPLPPFTRTEEIGEDEECISGLIRTETYLGYPRIHVLGFNWAGEFPVIGLGYRFEVGVYFPDEQRLTILKPEVPLDPGPPGEYDYDLDGVAGGEPPEVVSGKPFAKWTLGLDYSIGPVMINAQWVHGMVDEFGNGDFITPGYVVRKGDADAPILASESGAPSLYECGTSGNGERCAREILRPRIADYLVLGVDVNFARNAALFRLFTLWDLGGYQSTYWDDSLGARVTEDKHAFTPEGFSAVIYPEFQYNFGGGFELHVGALLQFGREYTKFGDAAAGGHQFFVRARYSF